MAKKRKGLFGIGSIENDLVETGKGIAGAVLFDIAMNKMRGHHGGGEHQPEGPVEGIMAGIEDMTGMKGHPVAMAAAGLILMQTEYREFGRGMLYIGAYNAVTSHPHVQSWGGGMHGIGSHDVLAAIEEGIAARMKELRAGEETQETVLAEIDDISSNEFEDLFNKSKAAA